MKNNGIEDILIGGDYNKKKKKGKGVLFVFFFLLIILAVLVFAYFYFARTNLTKKELFVSSLSNSNVKNFLQSNIYTKTYEKVLKQDSVTKSNINFSTTLKNEALNDIDLSKFVIELSNLNDVENSKSYNEAIVNYSGNEILKLKLLTTENAAAILLNELNEKYIGLHLDKITEVFEADIDVEQIKEVNNSKKIELSEEDKNNYVTKYFGKIFENIPEENFEVQENLVIKKNDEAIDVTSYTLKLSQEELNNILVSCLTTLRDDKELLKNFVSPTGNTENSEEDNEIKVTPEVDNSNEETTTENEEQENTINNEEVEQDAQNTETTESAENIETENTEGDEEQIPETSNQEESEDIPSTTVTTVEEETPEETMPVININPVSSINVRASVGTMNSENLEDKMQNVIIEPNSQVNAKDENGESSEIETTDINTLSGLNDENEVLKKYLTSILLGKKVNATVADLQEEIDRVIEIVKKLKGNGVIINVYVSSEKTEKIAITLPNENTIDIEFSKKSDTDNEIKITYLYDDDETNTTNGFSIDVKKAEKEANTSLILEYSFIEDKTINQKVTLNLNTDGTSSSKELNTDAVITVSTNEGETKVIIDNSVKFSSPTIEDELNSENCMFLDELPESELQTTLDGLVTQANTIYTNKKDNLSFIDTNTDRNPVDLNSASTTVTREEAKNALITRIGNMMQEAIDRNEEFTIQNLVGLEVEGYDVSTTVTEEKAVITIDVYTFNLSPEFLLTDAE